ncbi:MULTISPECIES: YqgE/AlgH family protein [unclassified Corynebacterium]|uniref:YqgE/AlgH family protein n=1 Tax=unclassified Corynebacterium TaxID=2624378 RepID=UPI0030AC317B
MESSDLFGDRLFNALERNDPAAGTLLVAAPGMMAPEFARSVIFIIEHDANGTLGVDLTARSETPVHNVMESWAPLMHKPPVVYIGGPVNQTQPLCIGVLKNGVKDVPETVAPDNGLPMMEKLAHRFALLNLGADPNGFSDYIESARIFVGYAGWEPGQLHDEIQRGDWFVAPALPSDVLAPAGADVWGDVMRRQSWPLPMYATFPMDVRDN